MSKHISEMLNNDDNLNAVHVVLDWEIDTEADKKKKKDKSTEDSMKTFIPKHMSKKGE